MNEGGGGSSAWRFTEAGRFLLQGEAHADALLMDAPAQSLPVNPRCLPANTTVPCILCREETLRLPHTHSNSISKFVNRPVINCPSTQFEKELNGEGEPLHYKVKRLKTLREGNSSKVGFVRGQISLKSTKKN